MYLVETLAPTEVAYEAPLETSEPAAAPVISGIKRDTMELVFAVGVCL